jgi:hypothetical protein
VLDIRSILRSTPACNTRPARPSQPQAPSRSWRRDPVVRATAEWLERKHDWTHYATLTFKDAVSEDHAHHALKAWMRNIARVLGNRHVPIVHGFERTKRGVPHFHALVAVPPHQPDAGTLALDWGPDPAPDDYATVLKGLWLRSDHRAGHRNKIEPYRRGGGGAGYLAKDGDWRPDTACPRLHACRRDQGCTEAATMWGNE